MKKALMNASVASMIYKFNMDNIRILQTLGYQVDVACNFDPDINPISREEIEDCRRQLKKLHCRILDTSCPRSVTNMGDMLKTYRQLKNIADHEKYDLVHTQSPIGGVLCRLATRNIWKKGCKVVYTAHGFHFYDGAPLLNWLLYYPIEKRCSKYTDVLVTINKEDCHRAQRKFGSRDVVRIPGIGIDTGRFKPMLTDDEIVRVRDEIFVPKDAIMVLSVGELNDNKNQQLIIKTLAAMNNEQIHYVLVGVGEKKEQLERLSRDLHISNRVHFLGYRTDIAELNNCADVFAFPSLREGLGMAPLEALACGTPVIGMNTRGIREYVIPEKTGYLFENDVNSCREALSRTIGKKKLLQQGCIETANQYSMQKTHRIMKAVYSEV